MTNRGVTLYPGVCLLVYHTMIYGVFGPAVQLVSEWWAEMAGA